MEGAIQITLGSGTLSGVNFTNVLRTAFTLVDPGYCDEKIKRHFNKDIFFLQNIVVTFQNLFK